MLTNVLQLLQNVFDAVFVGTESVRHYHRRGLPFPLEAVSEDTEDLRFRGLTRQENEEFMESQNHIDDGLDDSRQSYALLFIQGFTSDKRRNAGRISAERLSLPVQNKQQRIYYASIAGPLFPGIDKKPLPPQDLLEAN
jgi:hypothetical protein